MNEFDKYIEKAIRHMSTSDTTTIDVLVNKYRLLSSNKASVSSLFNTIIYYMLKYKKFDILLNCTKYIKYVHASHLDEDRVDYFSMIVLFSIIPNLRYREVFNLTYDAFDYTRIRMACLQHSNVDYFLLLHRKFNFMSKLEFEFEHVSVYDRRADLFYDIINRDSKVYIQNSSCVLNTFCYILTRENIKYEIVNILTLFSLMQLSSNIIYNAYESLG
jgi:hypothetical protein